MEILEKFVELPNEEIMRGIRIDKKTIKHFENEINNGYFQKIEQDIKGTKLISKVTTIKDNYKTTSKAEVKLEVGAILLFSEDLGYYPPQTRIGTIEDALETLYAQKDLIEKSYLDEKEDK